MWLRPHDRKKLESSKCCIFDPNGRLLWRSPAWIGQHDPRAERRLLGHEWTEFIIVEDIAKVLHFLRSGRARRVTFCCVDPQTATPRRIVWVKVAYGTNWLIYGDVVKCGPRCHCRHLQLPAPPCIVTDDEWGGGGLKAG
jgi:hypothetical protein